MKRTALVLLMTGLALGPSHAALIRIVASGEAPPEDDGTFRSFSSGLLNSSGQMFFSGNLQGTVGGDADNRGIYRASGHSVRLLLREGGLAPTGESFGGLSMTGISDPGYTALWLSRLGTTEEDAYYRSTGDGGLTRIAREGDPVPLSVGGSFSRLETASMNAGGDVVFRGEVEGGSFAESIHRVSATGQSRTVVREGYPVPDGNGEFLDFGDFSFNPPVLNSAGDVVFYAKLQNTAGGTTDDYGLFLAPVSGSRTQVAREGLPTPDGNEEFLEFFAWDLADDGSVAFRARVALTAGSETRLYRYSEGALTKLVRPGDTVPGVDGTIEYVYGAPTTKFHTADCTLFSLNFTGTAGGTTDDEGLFLSTPNGKLSTVMREGSVAPDGNGTFQSEATRTRLNRFGQVAYQIGLDGTSKGVEDDEAIFLYSPAAATKTIARKGDILDGKTISDLALFHFNDTGLILFSASFTDGSSGLYIYHPFSINRYTAVTDGAWDDDANWSSGYAPVPEFDTRIQPAFPAVVTGPAAAATVDAFDLDATGALPATLVLQPSGPLTATNGSTIDNGILSGSGQLAGDLTTEAASVIRPTGSLALGGPGAEVEIRGRLELGGQLVTITEANSPIFSGETVMGGGTLRIPGPNLVHSGRLEGGGRVAGGVENTGEIMVRSGETLRVDAPLLNIRGDMQCLGGAIFLSGNNVNIVTMGRIVARDALLDFGTELYNEALLAFSFGTSDVFGALDNQFAGRVIVSGGSNATFWDDVTHGGDDFRISSGSTVVFFGDVSGPGNFTGTGEAFFEGSYSPGASPALVNFGGDLSFGPGSTLVIELGGETAGDGYDRITTPAGIDLAGGILEVRLIDGFTPVPGQEFLILDAGSLTGDFSSVQLPPLPMGSFWDSSTLLIDGTLRVGLVPATYAEWRSGWGLPVLDAGDHDGDRIADVLEYHLGLNPTIDSSGSAGLPALVVGEVEGATRAGLEFSVPVIGAEDLRCRVEVSTDLQSWSNVLQKDGPGPWTGPGFIGSDPAAEGRQMIRIFDSGSVAADPVRFLRLWSEVLEP